MIRISPHFLRILAIIALFPAGTANAESTTLRIGLMHGSPTQQLKLSATSDYTICRTGSREKIASFAGSAVTKLEAAGNEISIKGDNGSSTNLGSSIIISSNDSAALIIVNGDNKYHGIVEVSAKSQGMWAVNVVDVEDYLRGVVPAEMPDSYPEESLKAQAIAARTYALENRGKHAADGYDLCDSTNCQVYMGASAERPKSSKAIEETSGQILTYNGAPASIQYSTDCGGATRDYASERTDLNAPYLHGVIEPDTIPHCTWQENYKIEDISAKLVRKGVKEAENLKSIAVTSTTSSGRAASVTLTGASTKVISGERFRSTFGLKSTTFTIATNPDGTITVSGKGWGHGIGMCQTGCKYLALAPYAYSCEKILSHYFPGTAISSIGGQSVAKTSKPAQETPPAAAPPRKIEVARVESKKKPAKQEQPDKPLFQVRVSAPDRL